MAKNKTINLVKSQVIYKDYSKDAERTALVSGENLAHMFGKIARWYTDISWVGHTHTEANITDFGTYAGASTKGGAATSANKLNIGSSDIGSETKPVYFNATTGKPVACAYSLNASVPANAVFTDINVKQSPSTANESREVLFAGNTGNTETTGTVGKSNKLYFNPNTGALTATSFSGSVDASNLTGSIDAGRLPTTSVTAGSYGPAAGGTLAHGGTFDVGYVTVDKYGRLTGASTKTFTLPAQYVHPSTSGNKHIPSGGSSGQYLKWSSDGTATWSTIAAADLPSHTHSEYLPLSGGTMTGDLAFTAVTSTSYPAVSNQISFGGSTDGAQIFFEVQASDAGALVIQTTDDPNAKIIFRNKVTSGGTRANEITIVDGVISGNGSGLTSLNASNISSGTIAAARLPDSYLPLSGGTVSGEIHYKSTNWDISAANNGVSSTQYPTTFNLLDKASRIFVRNEGIIYSNGNVGWYAYVRNYKTDGTQVAQKGLQFVMDKSGNLTWSVSDAANFRSAISAAAADHTHTLSMAADSGTSSITLTANTKYKLTAGGSTYVFTTPAGYTHPSYTSRSSGLYKITVDGTGHVSAVASVGVNDLPAHVHNYIDSILGANRLAFASPSGITVEHTKDGGSSWSTQTLADSSVFGRSGAIRIGNYSDSEYATANFKTRITVNTKTIGVYSELNAFLFEITSNGSNSCSVTISYSANGSSWTSWLSKSYISGWSGTNFFQVPVITCGDSKAGQYIRFLFEIAGGATSGNYHGMSILRIAAFGGEGWSTPSQLAKTDHLYYYDNLQNASFPAKVTASNFIECSMGATAGPKVLASTPSVSVGLHVGSGGTNRGLYDFTSSKNQWICYCDGTNNIFNGYALSADKWRTARTLTLSGSVTGSASIDGSGNVTLTTTTNHTHSYLPLGGGTLTGDLDFTGVTSTSYPAKSNQIYFSGSTDWAKIYYRVDASDAGRLVFDIGDDTNTRIDFAYNGTTKSYIDTSGNFSGASYRANYVDIVAGNEIRFSNETRPANAIDLLFGYAWSGGTKDAKINRYIFMNGNATLTNVKAALFEGKATSSAYTNYDAAFNIQTGSSTQSKISLETLINWLINTKKVLPSSTLIHKVFQTGWSYANNDFLRITCNGRNYEIQLAGVIIEFFGSVSSYNTGEFRMMIHTSPTTAGTASSGYVLAPTSTTFVYTCNGSEYSPTWKMITNAFKYANNYWGLTDPNGNDNDWTRTTSLGIIPYQSGGAGSGHQSIGTSAWYFSAAYIDTVYGALSGNASTASKWATARTLTLTGSVTGSASIDGSGNVSVTTTTNHTHSYLPLSGGTISNSTFGPLIIKRTESTYAAGIKFYNQSGSTDVLLGAIGMTGSANGGLIRWHSDLNTSYTILDTGNFKTHVTPSAIGAAASSHSHSSIAGASKHEVAVPTSTVGTGVLTIFYNVDNASGNMPRGNNANAIIQFNKHAGEYDSQLGFSSNGNIYYRSANGSAFTTSSPWRQLAWNDEKLGAISDGSYWGMATPSLSDTDWIRTTSSGLIPYQSGALGSGHQSIGTSSWYFDHVYSDEYNGYYLGLGSSSIQGRIEIKSPTTASVSYNSTNPRIRFMNASADQNIDIVMCDFDSVRGPAALSVHGNQGGEYLLAPNIASWDYTNNKHTAMLRTFSAGTTSAVGSGRVIAGNSTKKGVAGNARGYIEIYSEDDGCVFLVSPTSISTSQSGYVVTLPSSAGAMTEVVYKTVKTASSVTHSGWTSVDADSKIVPNMSFIAYWNGAYNSSGNSNLAYCNKGAFGTIITKGTGDYVANTDTGLSQAINKLSTGTSTPSDNDYYVAQYASGGTTTTSYHRRLHSALFSYINSKLYKILWSGSTSCKARSSTSITLTTAISANKYRFIKVVWNCGSYTGTSEFRADTLNVTNNIPSGSDATTTNIIQFKIASDGKSVSVGPGTAAITVIQIAGVYPI